MAETTFAHVYQRSLPSSPQAYSVLGAVGQQCKAYSDLYGSECEFEARFGTAADGSFSPGVSEEFYARVIELCRESTRWANESSTEYEDAYYPHDGAACRTRTQMRNTHADIVTSCKQNKLNWTLRTEATPTQRNHPDIRLSLAHEQPVHTPEGCVETTRYSIVQATSFDYIAAEYSSVILRLDLRNTWSGVTRSEAETLQRSCPGVKTIEIEVVNPHFFKHRFGPAYPALSMLVKMLDFIRHAKPLEAAVSPFSVQLAVA